MICCALRHQQVDQGRLQGRQPAAFQELSVAGDLGDQPLLGRHRKHPLAVEFQRFADADDLAAHFRLDLGLRLQRVPQAVDLVQHRDVVGRLGRIPHDVAPHVQVAFRDPGVGRQHEQHRMGAGDQRQRQFGLGADGVQPRRVQDDQPLLEQRMREIDHRVPPARNFDQSFPAVLDQLVRVVRVEQAIHARLVDAHAHGLGHQLKRLVHAVGRSGVDREYAPLAGALLEIGHGSESRARFYRQRPDARRQGLVVHQLGRAHRGAPGRRRQDAPAVIGEEDRVDQLGLAARELRDEGDHEAVAGQTLQGQVEPARRVGFQQMGVVQPPSQLGDRNRQSIAPGPVLLKAGGELRHVRNARRSAGVQRGSINQSITGADRPVLRPHACRHAALNAAGNGRTSMWRADPA